MSVACEPYPDVGAAAAVEGVRPGDGFLAGHSRRAASLAVQDRTAEGSMVGPRAGTTDHTDADAAVGAAGDRGSVAEQLAAVEPMVRGICRSRLGAADGDDAAQRTLVTLWRRLQADDRPQIQSLPAYAAVCARYEVLSSLGEFQRRPTVAIGEATERACVDDAPGPEAQALRAAEVAEAAARVEALLGQLTPAAGRGDAGDEARRRRTRHRRCRARVGHHPDVGAVRPRRGRWLACVSCAARTRPTRWPRRCPRPSGAGRRGPSGAAARAGGRADGAPEPRAGRVRR